MLVARPAIAPLAPPARRRRALAALPPVAPSLAPASFVRLVDVEPELAADLRGEELAIAERHLVVPAVSAPAGVWTPCPDARSSLAVLVVGGLIVRDGIALGRPDIGLYGPGDLLDPRLFDPAEDSTWKVLLPASFALLDARVVVVARRCPALMGRLVQRLFDGHAEHHRLAAIRALPRVEERVLSLLTHQASRWGRVTRDGITLDLPVTHELLGRLVGARRPTVSLALGELREQELLRRLPDGRWLLAA